MSQFSYICTFKTTLTSMISRFPAARLESRFQGRTPCGYAFWTVFVIQDDQNALYILSC